MKATLLFLSVCMMFAGVSCTSVPSQASSKESPPIILDANVRIGERTFTIASDPLIVIEQSVERRSDGVAHTAHQYVQ